MCVMRLRSFYIMGSVEIPRMMMIMMIMMMMIHSKMGT